MLLCVFFHHFQLTRTGSNFTGLVGTLILPLPVLEAKPPNFKSFSGPTCKMGLIILIGFLWDFRRTIWSAYHARNIINIKNLSMIMWPLRRLTGGQSWMTAGTVFIKSHFWAYQFVLYLKDSFLVELVSRQVGQGTIYEQSFFVIFFFFLSEIRLVGLVW